MKQYETMVIVDAMISDDAINNELEKIQQTIKNNEGEILRVDNWGKRKMAYPISKKTHGNYTVIYYNANEKTPLKLEKDFRINENILRWINLAEQPMAEEFVNEDEVTEEAASPVKVKTEIDSKVKTEVAEVAVEKAEVAVEKTEEKAVEE